MQAAAAENDLEFEAAAVAAFVEVFGQERLTDFRSLLAEAGGTSGFMLMLLCRRMELSDNDRKIFSAVAQRLKREIQAEQNQ